MKTLLLNKMMEVKQNTAVDLNELLVPPKTAEGTDELDDALMTDLSDEAASQDLNCDLIKSNDKSNNGLVVTNGDEALSSLMDIDTSETATGLDEDAPVSTELEDVLLAEDDSLPNVNDTKMGSDDTSPSVAEDDILEDKVETSNSTTSSSNDRDPGDDLDTLLSKINDIVDDCLDNEGGSTGVIPVPEEIVATDNVVVEKEKEPVSSLPLAASCENAEESVIFVEDPVDDEQHNIENDQTMPEETEDVKEIVETVQPQKQDITEITVNENEKKSETETEEETASKQQYEAPETTIEEVQEPVVPQKIGLEQPEDNIDSSIADTQIESEEITSEEEHSKEAVENDDKLPEETKEDISTDTEKEETEDANIPKVEQQSTIAAASEDSLEPNKNEDAEVELIDTHSSDNKDEEVSSKKQEDSLAIKDDIKDVSADGETEKKESDNDTFEKPKEIVEVTASVDEKKEETEEEATGKKDEESKNETHDDSDDEIVFYVDDKPPAQIEKDVELEKTETSETTLKQSSDDTDPKTAVDDDDVVILDDDDEAIEETDKKVAEPQEDLTTEKKSENETKNADDNEKTTPLVTNESPSKETSPKHSTNLDMDNSDNARDDFVTDKVAATTTNTSAATATTSATESEGKPQEIEETNSNCSSSSNLLLEAKTNDNSADDGNQEDNDNDNEEEDDDGDVELIENESKEAENSSEKDDLAPPAKRPRLSEDSQVSSNVDETSSKSQKATETVEEKSESQSETASLSTSSTLKRTHDVIELELDDKSNDSKVSANTEILTKKPRTEEKPKEEVASAVVDTSEVVKKAPKEEEETVTEDKPDIKKMIPSYKPIPLYPPPKLETLKSETTFSLDFLKKFRKSFDKMTKQDLEEMVLQKVVEAIIHKSEFADMRDLIEKQEKLISSHRTKITELSKQFRDLEMVHNRVVKDIEQRNSQFIMPVKITRAVGLQVYIPNKKTMMDSSTASSTGPSIIPASSPQRTISAASSQSNLTSPQRPLSSASSQTATDTQSRSGGSLSSAVNAAISNAVRRGCAQKITPTRPVPSSSATPSGPNVSAATTTVYRSNTNQTQTSSQPRILNKNATSSPAGGGGPSPTANAVNVQRSRYIPSNLETMRLQQQQAAASRPAANSQRIAVQPKPAVVANTTVPRRSEPAASTASANNTSSLDSYMNTLSQLTGGNTAVSITPAKPKEKAVIDLTDEDEVVPPPKAPTPVPAANTTTSNTASSNNGPAANPAPQRRSLPSQTNTNSSTQFARNAPPLARIPPINQMSNANKNRQTAVQGQKSTNSTFSSTISTPPGTSITRINVAANAQNPQRVKYSHPAPLPATPPQAFNPSWKLPPPRPTIRISNLDNGIVISWTMEESMDRHAECVSYQIYAYQETSGPPMADSWRHVGDVKAMLLPMAVTLTQFQEGQRYFFAVRAVDCHQRYGPFSLPKTWS